MKKGHARTKPRGEALRTPGIDAKAKPKGSQSLAIGLTIPVSYGTISFDDRIAYTTITIRRGDLRSPSANEADKNLCGRQVTGSILARPPGKGTAAAALFEEGPGEEDIQVWGLFAIGSLTLTPKKISAPLKISLDKLDRDKITRFAEREGLLIVTHVHELAGGKPQVEEEEVE